MTSSPRALTLDIYAFNGGKLLLICTFVWAFKPFTEGLHIAGGHQVSFSFWWKPFAVLFLQISNSHYRRGPSRTDSESRDIWINHGQPVSGTTVQNVLLAPSPPRHRNQQVTDAASPRTGSFQWTLPDWDITQPPRTEAVFLLSLSPNIVEVSQERGALCLSSLAVRSRSLRCSGNRARTRKYFLLKTWPSFPQITENRWVFIQWGQLLFSTLPWWNTFFLYV